MFRYTTISRPFHILAGSVMGRSIIECSIMRCSTTGDSTMRRSIMRCSICPWCVACNNGCVSAGSDRCDPSICKTEWSSLLTGQFLMRLFTSGWWTHCMGHTNKPLTIRISTARTRALRPAHTSWVTPRGHCGLGDPLLWRITTVSTLMLSFTGSPLYGGKERRYSFVNYAKMHPATHCDSSFTTPGPWDRFLTLHYYQGIGTWQVCLSRNETGSKGHLRLGHFL